MNFKESKTKENLARAFAGECQDGARYQFVSKQANSDGFGYISDTLKTLAKNEMAHAKVIYDLILKYGSGGTCNVEINAGYPFDAYDLKFGLKECAEVEQMESSNIYPSFARIAKDEGFPEAHDALMLISAVENCHYKLLSQLAEKHKSKTLYKKQKNKWKCSNCGHEHILNEAWNQCPLCNYPQGYAVVPLDS